MIIFSILCITSWFAVVKY